MCLHRITGYIQTGDAILEAWKVFERHESYWMANNALVFPHGTIRNDAVVPLSEWLVSPAGPGFHAFTLREHAEEYERLVYAPARKLGMMNGWKPEVHRVLLRQVHTFGVQNDMLAVIANEMFVPKENA